MVCTRFDIRGFHFFENLKLCDVRKLQRMVKTSRAKDTEIRRGHVSVCRYVNAIISHFEHNKVKLHVVANIRQKLKRFMNHSNKEAKRKLWNVITRHCLYILNRVHLTKKQERLFHDWMELKSHLDICESFTNKDVIVLYNEWAS